MIKIKILQSNLNLFLVFFKPIKMIFLVSSTKNKTDDNNKKTNKISTYFRYS